ncbi:transposase [Actinoplanes hulinensis]|uniref:Transposase n=1 Tax=Actinoplanes hulinensis TaxID=1144547 RepID=A0ABS7BD02_9ACTN|nr:RNA-guided endonuclease TnpB family protein [Actinoplanes hulinensis]MBW6438787.1 transposase [Actinoplanes hulinensis]
MVETVRYTYRLRPGRQAQAALLDEWSRCRWLWNEAVHQQNSGRKPTFGKLSKLLTETRSRLAWLRDGSQVAQQQTLRTYAAALGASFTIEGRGRPKKKRKKDALPSLEYTTRGFRIRDGRLHLPNKVTVPVAWSRELPSSPTSVRVYRDNLGHWYASFVVTHDRAETPEADLPGIGVDRGVKTTAATTSPGFDLPHLGHHRRCAAELAKAQRRMARRRRRGSQPQSKGYLAAKRQAARISKKAARQNTHDARAWAKRLTDHHALIAVEDFKPKFLTKSRMARKAADAAISACKKELIERGTRAGRKVVLVPPAYTTMTCSGCGERANHRLGLGVRTFECPACGYTADRDLNAARTILATAERDRASADDVRHRIASFRGGSGAV